MNENIDLTKILKDCPNGTKLYSLEHGEVSFLCINSKFTFHQIKVLLEYSSSTFYSANGKFCNNYNGECCLFPSREMRDWSKFTAPWYKKEKFDPKTLKAYDKVLVSDTDGGRWKINIFSHISNGAYPYRCIVDFYKRCIPYNDDTKHLVGTKEEAPEYYRYWED